MLPVAALGALLGCSGIVDLVVHPFGQTSVSGLSGKIVYTDYCSQVNDRKETCVNEGLQIYVVAMPSGTITRVTDVATGGHGIEHPVWSRDGSRIAFVTDKVYVINADGSNLAPVIDGGGPEWSPGDSQLAISHQSHVAVVNVDGTGLRNVTPDSIVAFSPAWSPDGATLAFNWNGHIATIGLDGSNLTRVTGVSDSTPGPDALPDWSPDGNRIVFQRDANVFVVNRDGSGLAPVTALTGRDYARDPRWSPDGALILFSTPEVCGLGTCTAEEKAVQTGLYVIAPDGTGARRIFWGIDFGTGRRGNWR